MTLGLFAVLTGNTLVLASLYALVGIGFVILFRATALVNFAQGTFMVLSAYLFYTMLAAGLPIWLAAIIAILLIALVGALVYVGAFHRLIGADLFVTVIATMGLSLVVQTFTFLIWGPEVRPLPQSLPVGTFVTILGIPLSQVDVIAISASVSLILVLELGLQRTVLGTRMRAVADSAVLAGLSKVNVHAVSALAWSISALCTGVAGIAVALRVGAVDPVSIGQLGLLIFPVVIIGGVDSIRGAMVGGLLVAITQNLAVYFLGGNWVNPAAYAILLLVLLLRPRGLFGSRAVTRI
jgi:branched-chain amino acid transport system permease protein